MPNVRDELSQDLEDVKRNTKRVVVEPTEAEKRNGWTRETLSDYLSEREAGQSLVIDVNSLHRKVARRSNLQNHKYSPLRWR